MRRLVVGWAVVAALLSGCAGTTAGEAGFVSGDGTITTIPVAERVAAPVIEGEDLDGTAWSSEEVAGTVLVYNVWGSWCAPCRAEAPELEEAAQQTAGTAVFIGLNTRDLDRASAKAFVRTFEVSYRNLFDPDGSLLLQFSPALPASAIPSTLIVDAEGRLAARIIGATTRATLVGLVSEIAGGR